MTKKIREKFTDFHRKFRKKNNRYRVKKISKEFIITIEEQVKGIETIVGLKSDEELGNFIMFGMGGTYVNIFKDINFKQAPLTTQQAKTLIQSSKVSTLLNGYRGDKAVNLKALEKTIENISYIQEIYPQIKEVDFNPIICDEHDCWRESQFIFTL